MKSDLDIYDPNRILQKSHPLRKCLSYHSTSPEVFLHWEPYLMVSSFLSLFPLTFSTLFYCNKFLNVLFIKTFVLCWEIVLWSFLRTFFVIQWEIVTVKKTTVNLVGNYLLKVINRNTRTRCGICSKLTIKTPERCHLHRFAVFIANFEHILHLILVFL